MDMISVNLSLNVCCGCAGWANQRNHRHCLSTLFHLLTLFL